LKTCLDQRITISLSLDALGAEHDRLRGLPGLFEHTVATFAGLAQLKTAYPQLRLTCSICVSGLNYQSVEETMQWAWEQLTIDSLKIMLVRGAPRDIQALDSACVQPYLDLVRHEEGWRRQHIHGRFRPLDFLTRAKELFIRDLTREILMTHQLPVRCGAARENVVIYADGTLAGCELRPETLGSLRDVGMNIDRLWRERPAQNLRACIEEERCCCYHHAFLSLPVLRSPRMWPRLIRSAWLAQQTR
jgi:MoaA/NifB/PqqE/SkfB family radical SAM enzyme